MKAEWLMGPLVGALIGYITNGIAIKMLFRPLRPIYILGKKLPFTPGIIPKEKERIAKSIGQVVAQELIDAQTLKGHLLSNEMQTKIENSIEQWLVDKKQSDVSLRASLETMIGESTLADLSLSLEQKVAQIVYRKIVELDIARTLAESACDEIKGNLGAFAMFLNDSLLETAKVKLEKIIGNMIQERAEEMLGEIIKEQTDQFLSMSFETLFIQIEAELPKIKTAILKQYKFVIETQLETMLKQVDIAKIVEERIRAFDILEFENLILAIMQKELQAIIWLGALLGMLMGIVMSIF